MSSSLVLTVKADESQSFIQQILQLSANKDREAALALSRYFRDLAGTRTRGSLDVQTGSAAPVAASATWTLDTVVATDTVTIGPITFTGTDTPSTSLHFDTSLASDALIAADIARAVNEHATTSQIVVASADGDVVTVTALAKGVAGNFIPISDADSTITTSAAFLSGGTGGVTEAGSSFSLGL